MQTRILVLFLFLAVALLLFRMFAFMRGMLFILVALGAVGVIIWGVRELWRIRKEEKAFRSSPSGRIQGAIAEAQALLEKNKQELEEINHNVLQLKQALLAGPSLNPLSRENSEQLLKDFEKEAHLRTRRMAFYETCLGKLETVQHNLRFAQLIEEKRAKLLELRTGAEEERASLESIKSAFETEVLTLDTIDSLAARMELSVSAEDAEVLQVELEKITKDIQRFELP